MGRVTPAGPPGTGANGSLPAGTGRVPYQFTTLGQAITEFSKPLDVSGLFKYRPGTCLFDIPPAFSLPQQGKWDTLWGSLPLLGCPGPSSPEPPGRGCMPLAPCHP